MKICVPITGRSMQSAAALINEANESADIIELRADYLSDASHIPKLLKMCKKPAILTIRPKREFGLFAGAERERIALLEQNLGHADYVDVELRCRDARDVCLLARAAGVVPIVSYHANATPSIEKLRAVAKKQLAAGAGVCKIVCAARMAEDNLRMLEFVAEASKKHRIVAFCMGENGAASRVLSPLLGAEFTFASLGAQSAPGQIGIREMRKVYEAIA
jgi:3-dehydroquinate dehydratase-1